MLAVLHTTVANVVFIMASAPLIAAAGAWLLLRERIETRTLGAMVAAVIGIASNDVGRTGDRQMSRARYLRS